MDGKSELRRQSRDPSLWKSVAIGVVVFGAILLSRFPEEWRWESTLWYANLNGIGGGLAVFLGSILLLIRPFLEKSDYLVVAASAFIAAGLSGTFGILVNDTPVCLWFESQALVLGGILLCGLWMPRHLIRRHFKGRHAVMISAGISLFLSGWVMVWGRERFAAHPDVEALLAMMRGMKFAGGVLLLAALPRIATVIPAAERGMLFTVTLFLGLGAMSFPLSRMWGLEWWLIQVARYGPFFLAVRYVLDTFLASQRALIESEERFKALFNAAPVGIGIIDNRNNAYWQANPALCRMTGFTAEELSQVSVKSFMFPEDVPSAFELRNKLFRGELSDYCATRKYVTRDGRDLWVKVRGTLIRSPQSTQEFRIVEDVTGEKVANDRVTALVQELTRANTELGRFAAVASHDLKSPLNTVTSYVQLIAEGLSDSESADLKRYAKVAVNACGKMRALIDDLLAYASVSQPDHRHDRVDCGAVLDEVIENLQNEIHESDAQILASQLPTVSGDRTQLVRLFQNLIGNAIKYRGESRPIIRIDAEQIAEGWRFSVSDNGIGFEMEHAEKVFDEFARLRSQSEYTGTGLGLPICKAIVTRHGGRIWVESAPGEGSVFYFTLPRPELHESRAEPAALSS